MIDDYLRGSGLTFDEYILLIEEQAPYILAKLNLSDAIMREYCEEHGLEYTGVNMHKEVSGAVLKYEDELYEKYSSEVQYFKERLEPYKENAGNKVQTADIIEG